ncbi:SDR family oxidoreductase [Desulfallas sp. Bu1-1]|uniref:SDR family NAD(P)-dependent oxidoreductase n=1 Tax=Desulfallas sp. Bu1-1 TaxID=2787620 RepID=UPI00189FFDC3|nr:SDR family NAD(P)-dependent oxidoreductase [Desulfallas sp. Bu1-1]MBF7082509.1 SDR family oxidoreductase [Desulfallas sp. Bu1-1]
MLLENKVAIVTGGGSGIGKSTAKAMAEVGARVVIADINSNCGNVVNEIPNSVLKICDVGDENSVQDLVENVAKEYGRIDILVNNAGIIVRKSAVEHTYADWTNVIRVNLTGTFLMSKYVVPVMIRQQGGCIINIGSLASLTGYKNAAYAASKAGVVNFTRSLAMEVAKYGIRVNSICPGVIKTELNRSLMEQPEILAKLLPKIPQGRVGTPEDIAKAAVFLASDWSDYVNGTSLLVDGAFLSGITVFD